MLLCLDVGNSHILGGVFKDDQLLMRFRYATYLVGTSDQFGIFLINILKANGINEKEVHAASVCSVVPSCDYTIRHTLLRYFQIECFMLQAGVKTGLNVKTKNPNEVGADLIANAIGAVEAFPNRNIITVDMGTATTVDAITKTRDYLGCAIMPGLRLCMESLRSNTAKLMTVEIETPVSYIGKTTREAIQSGLFYGHLGSIKEIIAGYQQEFFADDPAVVIATGGFSQLYKDKGVFDCLIPDLVLQGLKRAIILNS